MDWRELPTWSSLQDTPDQLLTAGYRVRHGSIVWELTDEQPAERPDPGGPRTRELLPPRTLAERIVGSRRSAAGGRIWKAVGFDEQQARAQIRAYDAWAGLDTVEPDFHRVPAGPDDPATSWTPSSWTHFDCSGSSLIKENHVWEGEGRSAIGSSHNHQELAAVTIQIDGQDFCTGTMVDGDEVLTAAHCVSTCGAPIDRARVGVCHDASGVCASSTPAIDYIGVTSSFTGGGGCSSDFTDDWAIISLDTPIVGDLVPDSWAMPLSNHSDSVLAALNVERMFGIDQWISPACTSNAAMLRNTEVEPIATIYDKSLRHKADGSPGSSGRPYYFCPAGDDDQCTGDDTPYVYGVQAGWNSVVDRQVGPKVRYFRDIAILYMDL